MLRKLNYSREICATIFINSMAYWLVKSEPFKYSFDQLTKEKKTVWDGIRNYAARLNLRAMKKGDQMFFYHSNEGMNIVGIAKVVREAYPEDEIGTWSAVDIAPVKKLKKPVSLADIKADGRFNEMDLIRLGRLSVQKVRETEWDAIMKMAETK